MRLVRFGPVGDERPGVLDEEGQLRDVSKLVEDWHGPTLDDRTLERVFDAVTAGVTPVGPRDSRLGSPVGGISKIVCAGLNYHDHAREAGFNTPSEPVLFMKAPSALCGPFDPIELPPGSAHLDWEVELGVVVGKRAKRVTEAVALDHVAGFCVLNDLSERLHQNERGGQWTKGKSADTFAPIGPWLLPRAQVADPQRLAMYLDVNGIRFQSGSTSDMVFGVSALIAYISQFMTLLPGDLVATGTPAGVGMGLKPPKFLRAGDQVQLGIEGLGEQSHRVIRATEP